MTYKEAYRLISVWSSVYPFTKGGIWIYGRHYTYPYGTQEFDLKKFFKIVEAHETTFWLKNEIVTIEVKYMNKLTITHNDPIQKEEWK